ncbi:MAG: hypothetical protein JRN52_06535 [Nitrososphaerota archaeon]|nr:hypothetical protein [Nitrososphaerota archaeon]
MRVTKNIFEQKASRIVRVLLINEGTSWTTRELAREANVSLSYTHATISSLLKSGYVARKISGNPSVEVVDPIRLLNRWASYNDYLSNGNQFIEYYSYDKDIDIIMDKLASSSKVDYALTSLSGAWLVSPYVRPIALEAYVYSKSDADSIARALDLNPIPKDGNVRLVIPYDNGVFYKTQITRDVKVVSDVQLYVDLYNFPARGEEASGRILERIKSRWADSLLSEGKNEAVDENPASANLHDTREEV